MHVGIIGKGTIGSAIAAGLRAHPRVRGIETTTSRTAHRNPELARDSDVLMLCVKPRHIDDVLQQLAPELRDDHVIVSTLAGVSASDLRKRARGRFVCAMPNTPLAVNASMTVIMQDQESCEEALRVTESLFAPLGETMVLSDRHFEAVTAVSGCGPAYALLVMEALIDAAMLLGLSYRDARTLVGQTMLGAASLLLQSDEHPAALKCAVTTPGGRTARGLQRLETAAVRSAFADAIAAAAQA